MEMEPMARRRNPDLNDLERDAAASRRAIAETLLALRRRRRARASHPVPLDYAGAKPDRPVARGISVAGALVGLAFIVPRILVKMSQGRDVG
jgi:hypothetical protein